MFLPQPLKYALICLDAHIINYMPEILPAEGSVYIQVIFKNGLLQFDDNNNTKCNFASLLFYIYIIYSSLIN